VTVRVEWETQAARLERSDHEGTTEPLDGSMSVWVCAACGKTDSPSVAVRSP